jgi:hypothetical protein
MARKRTVPAARKGKDAGSKTKDEFLDDGIIGFRGGPGEDNMKRHVHGRLTLTQKKVEQSLNHYNFENGLQKVQNLTRYHLRRWEEDSQAETIDNDAEPTIKVNRAETIELEDNLYEEFPYAFQDPLQTRGVEAEKEINSDMDRVLEEKRLEAVVRLRRARERRVESHRLMALYRLNLKKSLADERDGRSIFLTQEQLKKIRVSKTKAIEKLRQRPNAEVA